MPYSIRLPDGTLVNNIPDEVTPEQAKAKIMASPQYAGNIALKKSTIAGELGRGVKQYFSDTGAGIAGLGTDPEKTTREGIARSQQINTEAGEDPISEVMRAYKANGLASAVGTGIAGIPRAVAGQAGNLGAMYAAGKLGAVTGGALAGPPGALVGAGLGATASMLPQFFQQNLAQQVEAQEASGQPVSLERGKAGVAAVGQAALEGAGTAFTLGIKVVKRMLGIADDAALAAARTSTMAEKALAKQAMLRAAGSGAVRGALAEVPVEVAQQILQRAQAGQPLLDDDAMEDYGKSAVGALQVGVPLGGLGRVVERSGAKTKVADEEAAAERTAREQRDAQEEAYKKSPEYLLNVKERYDAAVQGAKERQAALPPKVNAAEDPAGYELWKAAQEERTQYIREVLKPVTQEYSPIKKQVEALVAQQEAARVQGIETDAAKGQPTAGPAVFDPNPADLGPTLERSPQELPARTKSPEELQRELAQVQQQYQTLDGAVRQIMEQLQPAIDTRNVDVIQQLAPRAHQLNQALQQAQKRMDELKAQGVKPAPTLDADRKSLQRKLANAYKKMDEGNFDPKTVSTIQELEAALKALPVTPDLFGQENLQRADEQEQARRDALAERLQQAPQAGLAPTNLTLEALQQNPQAQAENQRLQTVGAEAQKLRQIAQRPNPTPTSPDALAARQRDAALVSQLVDTLPQAPAATGPGRIVEGSGVATRTTADIERDLALARGASGSPTRAAPLNRERVQELVEELRQARDDAKSVEQLRAELENAVTAKRSTQLKDAIQRKTLQAAGTMPELQRVLGSKLPKETIAANKVTHAAERSRRAFQTLLSALNRVAVADKENTPAPVNDVVAARREVVAAVEDEVVQRRAAQGLPEMTLAERVRLVDQIQPRLTELVTRWSKSLQPRIGAQTAQTRAGKLVRGTTEGRGPDTGGRVFGNPMAAAQTVASDLEAIKREFAPTQEAAVRKPVESKARLVTPTELTLRGESTAPRTDARRAGEAVKKLERDPERKYAREVQNEPDIKSVKDMKDIHELFNDLDETRMEEYGAKPEDIQLLTQARDLLDQYETAKVADILPEAKVDPKLTYAELVAEEAYRVMTGREMDPSSRQLMQDVQALQQQEQGQKTTKDMFGDTVTERATAENFQKFLNSKEVAKLREKWAKEKSEASEGYGVHVTKLDRIEAQYREAVMMAESAVEARDARNKELSKTLNVLLGKRRLIEKGINGVQLELDDAKHTRDVADGEKYIGLTEDERAAAQELRSEAEEEIKRLESLAKALDLANRQVSEMLGGVRVAMGNVPQTQKLFARVEAATAKAKDAADKLREAKAKAREAVVRKGAAPRALDTEEAQRRAVLQRAQTGLGLPVGARVTRDTASPEARKIARGLQKQVSMLQTLVETEQEPGKKQLHERQLAKAEERLAQLYGETPKTVETAQTLADKQSSRDAFEREQRADQQQEIEAGQSSGALTAKARGPVMRVVNETARDRKGSLKESGKLKTPTAKAAVEAGNTAAQERGVEEDLDKSRQLSEDAYTRMLNELRGRMRDITAQLTFIDNKIAGYIKDDVAPPKHITDLRARLMKELGGINRQLRVAGEPTRAEARLRKQASKYVEEFAAAEDNEIERVDKHGGEDLATGAGTSKYNPTTYTLLNNTAADSLKDNKIYDALSELSVSGSTPFVKDTAAKLQRLLGNTQVEVRRDIKTFDGKTTSALYQPATDTISIDPGALIEENLLHEATHAATIRALTLPDTSLTPDQRAAKREINAIYQTLDREGILTGEYAAKNIKEFVSEVMSNKNLQEKIDARKAGQTTLWQRLKNAILRLLGVNPKSGTQDIADVIERLFMPSAKIEAGEAATQSAAINRVLQDTEHLVAKRPSAKETFQKNFYGLAGRMQFIDNFAPVQGVSEVMKDTTAAMQMMYYIRKFGQRMHLVQQAAVNGVPQLIKHARKDGRDEWTVESMKGANLKDIAKTLATAPMDKDKINALFSRYLIAIRANDVGLGKLDFAGDITQDQIDEIIDTVKANPELHKVFETARKEYGRYNKDLMNWLVQTGTMTQQKADELTKSGTYVPYYRQRDGVVEMMVGNERPIRVGSLKDQKHLHELVGGDQPITDFATSSLQNTALLTEMGIRNLALKNTMFELAGLKLAKINRGNGPAGPNVVRFRKDGEEFHAAVDTDSIGIPADLLVKGLEGIATTIPAGFKLLAAPAQFLRKAITLNPMYAARQLFRDTTSAYIGGGVDGKNLLNVVQNLKDSPTKRRLEAAGVTGGQVFTGTVEDMSKISRDIMANKGGAWRALAKLESLSMEADAVTRRAQYDSYKAQGLSDMEAEFQALESMNFSRRGLSPTVHIVSQLVPFFNAQLQSLDVLYRSATGKMSFNDRLDIQRKLLTRGSMLAAMTLMYAAAMQDDDAYKNATPDEKYNNWFVRVPGVDQAVKIPIPFELGYVFKAIPEALYNTMANDDSKSGRDALKAFNGILLQLIPGGSSMPTFPVGDVKLPIPIPLPAAVKPAVEVALGRSFFTGRDIESQAEQRMEPSERVRDNTTQVAKELGEAFGMSPILIEHAVRGYSGAVGIAMMAAAGAVMPSEFSTPEKPTARMSDLPIVGSAFQPNDSSGVIDDVYNLVKKVTQIQKTYESMNAQGRRAEAQAYLQRNVEEMSKNKAAGAFTQRMGELTKFERAIKASDLTPDEKRQRLTEIRAEKIRTATQYREVLGKT